jgi:glutamyl-tRNA synthetase/nondiscriminating glutamyl-tRNA synthetase
MAPRVRFAPSPTGQLHVGNARTALFNWLFARRFGGTFILRIEDTDTERSTRASEAAILDDLRWLGLHWDEGPDVGGPHAPYRQSDRSDRYAAVAAGFLADAHAYRCFCTPATLEADRAEALAAGRPPKYVGRCRRIDPAEAARRVDAGEPAALRFAVPAGREVTFQDLVRGPVTFDTGVIGDPVIVRSDGRPAYNFAVVVDDADMAITHVVRGEDHLSNTPRQMLIYEAIGARPPAFAHLALVLGPDHAPLSKRHGATSVVEFREHGYLPESLVNYLALLGWSPGDGRELLTAEDLIARFDLADVSHSAAVFDVGKLAWMNRHYMKEADPRALVTIAWPYFVGAAYAGDPTDEARAYVASLLPMVVGSVDRVEEIPGRVAFVFEWSASAAAAIAGVDPQARPAIAAMAEEVASSGALDKEAFRAAAVRVRERTGLKGRALFHPIRIALTGAESGPELDLAVPAIDRGAALGPLSGLRPIPSCARRLKDVAARLRPDDAGA